MGTTITQAAQHRDREIVVPMAQLTAAAGRQLIPLGRTSPSTVGQLRCGCDLDVTGSDQCIQVPSHSGGADSQLIADLTSGDGSTLEDVLDHRRASMAIRPDGRMRNGRVFHNTSVT